MKKSIVWILMFSMVSVCATAAWAGDKATPEDVYNLVLKGYQVLSELGEEGLPAFNDPKGEFVIKDTYIFVEKCPSTMVAHPFALEKLKNVDLSTLPFNERLCKAAKNPNGRWAEYNWPKPGATEPSRKISFMISVEGTPYQIGAGIYNDEAKVEDLNSTLQ